MTQLTQKDLDVLGFYAGESNRELYWNYLAQKEGNDGYGLLALGVVRNDNAPGATANAFAARSAEQSSIQLTERQWDAVGRDLIEQDYSQRRRHFTVDRHLALNLPAKAVQDAHDAAFTLHKVPLNAWTPRELLENARTKAGESESERIWRAMLDNEAFGVTRVGLTSRDVSRYADSAADAGDYIARMTAARMEARDALPTTDPDAIRLAGIDYRRHADGQWRYDATTYAQAKGLPETIERDPRRLAELEDTRALRLEQAAMRTQFHPDDPNRHRPLARSPWLLAGGQPDADARDTLAMRDTLLVRSHDTAASPGMPASAVPRATSFDPTDPRDPLHPRHALWTSTETAVRRLDASLGRTPDAASERMTASLYARAVERGMTRVDHVVLSIATADRPAGHTVFAVQGALDDPAKLRTQMPTADAIAQPVEASLRQANAVAVPVLAQAADMPAQALTETGLQVLRRA